MSNMEKTKTVDLTFMVEDAKSRRKTAGRASLALARTTCTKIGATGRSAIQSNPTVSTLKGTSAQVPGSPKKVNKSDLCANGKDGKEHQPPINMRKLRREYLQGMELSCNVDAEIAVHRKLDKIKTSCNKHITHNSEQGSVATSSSTEIIHALDKKVDRTNEVKVKERIPVVASASQKGKAKPAVELPSTSLKSEHTGKSKGSSRAGTSEFHKDAKNEPKSSNPSIAEIPSASPICPTMAAVLAKSNQRRLGTLGSKSPAINKRQSKLAKSDTPVAHELPPADALTFNAMLKMKENMLEIVEELKEADDKKQLLKDNRDLSETVSDLKEQLENQVRRERDLEADLKTAKVCVAELEENEELLAVANANIKELMTTIETQEKEKEELKKSWRQQENDFLLCIRAIDRLRVEADRKIERYECDNLMSAYSLINEEPCLNDPLRTTRKKEWEDYIEREADRIRIDELAEQFKENVLLEVVPSESRCGSFHVLEEEIHEAKVRLARLNGIRRVLYVKALTAEKDIRDMELRVAELTHQTTTADTSPTLECKENEEGVLKDSTNVFIKTGNDHEKNISDSGELPPVTARMSDDDNYDTLNKENKLVVNPGKTCALEDLFENEALQALRKASGGSMRNALLQWCQAQTRGYNFVDVTNFSYCWQDGMALCALLHSIQPSLIDYAALDFRNPSKNFKIATQVAKWVGVKTDLDYQTLMQCESPTWKIMYSYVAELFTSTVDLKSCRRP